MEEVLVSFYSTSGALMCHAKYTGAMRRAYTEADRKTQIFSAWSGTVSPYLTEEDYNAQHPLPSTTFKTYGDARECVHRVGALFTEGFRLMFVEEFGGRLIIDDGEAGGFYNRC